MFDVLVVGAGPAGLAAGIAVTKDTAANNSGVKVCVVERNASAGKKLLLSGSGQCNLTHGGDIADFLQHYGGEQKARFVKPALLAFDNAATVRFFEEHNVPLVERENKKVFPRSLSSCDVLSILTAEFQALNKELRTNTAVLSVKKTDGQFCVQTNHGELTCKNLILATGGSSYPSTGSDGSGFVLAKQLKHKIAVPKPALTPVVVRQPSLWFSDLAGIAIRQTPIVLLRNGKKIAAGQGDVLFTHHGLSGPAVLKLSRFIEKGDVLKIALCRNAESISSLLTGKKNVRNALSSLDIPEQVLIQLLEYLDIPYKPASEVSRAERKELEHSLSGFPFVAERIGGWNEAMATAGGVSLQEVDRQTMQSRLVPNLFFCGEVLDIDGDTGGYNIQFALSSGMLAGNAARRFIASFPRSPQFHRRCFLNPTESR